MPKTVIPPASRTRKAEHPINALFLDRWSPRAMTGEPIPEPDLLALFEAAKWAPSSSNGQPWRMMYARRDTPAWETFFGLLVEFNQAWCKNASALVVFVSKGTTDSGRPAPTHSYDTGAAWMSFAAQGWMSGYVVHGMAGFDYARAKTDLGVPDGYTVEAMAAVGVPGDTSALPAALQERESPSTRRPLADSVREGKFSF